MSVEQAANPPEEQPSSPVAAEPLAPAAAPVVASGKTRRPHRARRYASGFLVFLFSLSLFVSILSIWGARQVLNTDVFVSNVSTVIKDPAVQAELTDYVSAQVVKAVDPAKRLSSVLPSKAQPIVAPVVAAFQNLVHTAVGKLVAAPKFHDLLLNLVRRAHTAAVALLEGKTKGNLVLHGNEVVLNVLPLIDSIIQKLESEGVLSRVLTHVPPLATANGSPSTQVQQLASALGVTLPPDFGQIVVFKSDTLHQAQAGLKHLRRGIILAVIITLVLLAGSLLVAPFRLRTLAQLGIGAAVVGLVAWAATQWATNHIVQLATNGHAKAALKAIIDAETNTLTTAVLIVAAIGFVVMILAYVFGDSRTAARTRAVVKTGAGKLPVAGRSVQRFVLAHTDGVRVLGVAVGLLIFILWLSWTGFFVALGVVALWELGVWWMGTHAGETTGPPSAGEPTEAAA